jgi:protocatechuate 3,4-dioxygenase alpha subunit
MEKLPHTPSQTIGPFFAYSLTAEQYGYNFNSIVSGSLINDTKEDEQIFITGNIFDGAGNAIHDAMIELWQADANGSYMSEIRNPKSEINFTGFGRLGTGTESDKSFTFKTIKPGQVNNQAPHINIILFMRGSLHALYTRLYFDDEQNDKDSLLNAIDAGRRNTLLAHKKKSAEKIVFEFNIYMQGENETVFFEVH